jgi:excisionase family DNA binding protein
VLEAETPHLQEAFPAKRVAQLLGVSIDAVRGLIKSGDLRAHRLGPRQLRIFPKDLEEFLATRRASRSAV